MVEPFHRRQRFGFDFVQAAEIAGQRMDLALDGLTDQILEVIVIRVHAIERRIRGMGLVKISEQIVGFFGRLSCAGGCDPSMVQ